VVCGIEGLVGGVSAESVEVLYCIDFVYYLMRCG